MKIGEQRHKSMNIKTFASNYSGLNRKLRTVFVLLGVMLAVAAFSQISEEWLLAITTKNEITYESYSQYGDFHVFGEKGYEGNIETYKAATVIEWDPEGYWIIKSEKVSYDPNLTILDINDCIIEKFINSILEAIRSGRKVQS